MCRSYHPMHAAALFTGIIITRGTDQTLDTVDGLHRGRVHRPRCMIAKATRNYMTPSPLLENVHLYYTRTYHHVLCTRIVNSTRIGVLRVLGMQRMYTHTQNKPSLCHATARRMTRPFRLLHYAHHWPIC